MPFSAEINLAPLEDVFAKMQENIDHFRDDDMAAELVRWQIEDMHRQYPNLEYPDENSAMTRIWPTSRVNLRKWPNYRTSRPLLRASLWADLVERMGKLMVEKIAWR
jgi:hypothetical protein